MNNEVNELITVEELCEILIFCFNTSYKIQATGELKAFRINRVWKIPRVSVIKYIQDQSGF